MGKVHVERPISSSAEEVWIALSDYGAIYKFNPNVAESFVLDGSPSEGIGARRRCNLSDGKNHILEKVTAWRPGESYTVDIYDGTMPLRTAHATLGVKPNTGRNGLEASIAFMEMEYIPKFGAIGRIMDAFVLQREMDKLGKRVLLGLADFVSSKHATVNKLEANL